MFQELKESIVEFPPFSILSALGLTSIFNMFNAFWRTRAVPDLYKIRPASFLYQTCYAIGT
jgi:hypothetical protein